MIFRQFLVASCLAGSLSQPTFARDVQVLDFSAPGPITPVEQSLADYWLAPVPNTVEPAAKISIFATSSPGIVDHALSIPGQARAPTGWPYGAADPQDQSFMTCTNVFPAPAFWLPSAVRQRRSAYFALVEGIACEQGLPVDLLDAVIAQESGYAAQATSHAGAMGMMQIMPGTARELGLHNPFDPAANMRAGARYLRRQIDRFGRVDLALAAYNAGPERRSLKLGLIPGIPETVAYVRIIMTNWSQLAGHRLASASAIDGGKRTMATIGTAANRDVLIAGFDISW